MLVYMFWVISFTIENKYNTVPFGTEKVKKRIWQQFHLALKVLSYYLILVPFGKNIKVTLWYMSTFIHCVFKLLSDNNVICLSHDRVKLLSDNSYIWHWDRYPKFWKRVSILHCKRIKLFLRKVPCDIETHVRTNLSCQQFLFGSERVKLFSNNRTIWHWGG